MKTTLIALFLATTAFAERPNPKTLLWVGCRPSPGECYNSCPDHRSYSELDRTGKLCEFEPSFSKYACWCVQRPGRDLDADDVSAE